MGGKQSKAKKQRAVHEEERVDEERELELEAEEETGQVRGDEGLGNVEGTNNDDGYDDEEEVKEEADMGAGGEGEPEPENLKWTYNDGAAGPDKWGSLSTAYEIADKGKEQSPINIATDGLETTDGTGLQVHAGVSQCSIVNTGYTFKVTWQDVGSEHIEIDGRQYEMIQFHMHSPSEHTLNGELKKLELHLVHKAVDGQGPGPELAVVGVMFQEGETANVFLDQVLDKVPRVEDGDVQLENPISMDGLELDGEVYQYNGSLTTPPCSEGVAWNVIAKVHSASAEQIATYLELFPMETNRPIQKLNERTVCQAMCALKH